MKKALHIFLAMALVVGTTGMALANSLNAKVASNGTPRLEQRLSGEGRHELVMIPQYTLFDNLAYRVDGGTVTLTGQGRHATLHDSPPHPLKPLQHHAPAH